MPFRKNTWTANDKKGVQSQAGTKGVSQVSPYHTSDGNSVGLIVEVLSSINIGIPIILRGYVPNRINGLEVWNYNSDL